MEEGEIDYGDERSLISVVVTTLKDGEDQTYLVQLGPKWYLDLKGIYLLSKKNISITGTPIEVPNLVDKRGDKDLSKEEGILMAKEVQMGEYKVTLRDEKGVPVWYQRGRIKGILNNWQGQLKQDEMKKYMADMMQKQTGMVPQAGTEGTTQVPIQGQTATPNQTGGQLSPQQLEMRRKMQQQVQQGQTGTPNVTQGQTTTPSQMGGQVSPQ
jgi:hypothetical protein